MLDERMPRSVAGRFLVSLATLVVMFLVITMVFVVGGLRSLREGGELLLWFGVPAAVLGACALTYGVGYRRAEQSESDETGTR